MKRIPLFLSMCLSLGLLLAACMPSISLVSVTSTPAGMTLKDGLDRSVTLAAPAQKIISLAPSNTEILFAVGAGRQIVARDDFSDFPTEAKDLPSIGGSSGNLNLEQITSLQPDLVLASALNTPEQVKALENLKLTVYYLPNPTDMDGLYQNLETVGQLTGHEKEAKALADSLHQRVDRVVQKVSQANKPLVFYELDGSEPSKPWTAGPGTFVDTLLQMAGGRNIGNQLSSAWAQISQEELITGNPDVILLGDAAYGVTPEQVAARPGWNGIKAVTQNKMFAFDDNLVSRPGPRLVDGLEAMAKILHPELYP